MYRSWTAPLPQHRGFGSRYIYAGPISRALRQLRLWLRRGSDRAIGAQLNDFTLNPFLFLTESAC